MIIFLAAYAAASSGVVPQLSGEVVNSTAAATNDCDVAFRADGTVDTVTTQFGTVQIDNATDWIIPNGAANSTYDIRYINLTGDAFFTSSASENTWIDLGSDRQWGLRLTGTGSDSTTVTFEIRDDHGTTVASAEYTFNIVVL